MRDPARQEVPDLQLLVGRHQGLPTLVEGVGWPAHRGRTP